MKKDILKILYFLLLIFLSVSILFFFAFQWELLDARQYLPKFLQDRGQEEGDDIIDTNLPPVSDLEWERIKKERLMIKEKELELENRLKEVKEKLEEIQTRERKLLAKNEGLKIAEQKRKEENNLEKRKAEKISQMASRLYRMPPADAVKIIVEWPNKEIVEVLREMERTAEQEDRQSIVPYLLTLMPEKQAALVLQLMMDAQADKLPATE